MKSFPDNITPFNINLNDKKNKHHKNKLVYCRTKRACLSCGWICNTYKKILRQIFGLSFALFVIMIYAVNA